ncbi:MAG: hypothetical protein KDI54_19985, partial [Gammaproteobacteria bacterium]|nr:hypothetical protein [Gammaproteobacteria bacterium]
QMTWVESDGWYLVTIALFSNGEIARLWAPNVNDPEQLECGYSRQKLLSGNSIKCPPLESVFLESMHSGCVARVGTTYRNVHGCKYD